MAGKQCMTDQDGNEIKIPDVLIDKLKNGVAFPCSEKQGNAGGSDKGKYDLHAQMYERLANLIDPKKGGSGNHRFIISRDISIAERGAVSDLGREERNEVTRYFKEDVTQTTIEVASQHKDSERGYQAAIVDTLVRDFRQKANKLRRDGEAGKAYTGTISGVEAPEKFAAIEGGAPTADLISPPRVVAEIKQSGVISQTNT